MFMAPASTYTHIGQRVEPRPPRIEMHITRAKRLQWFVLRVISTKEDAVAEILQLNGVSTVIPKIERYRYARRYKGAKAKRSAMFPILPGYVITGFSGSPNWFAIQSQNQITGVLGVRGVPQKADPKDVARMSLIGDKGIIPARSSEQFMVSGYEFYIGDKALVIEGPLTDFVVDVSEIEGEFAMCRHGSSKLQIHLSSLIKRGA